MWCRYGSDKPDLRFGLHMATIDAAVRGCGFKIFADTVEKAGTVKALVVPEVCCAVCCDVPVRAMRAADTLQHVQGARISNSRLKPNGDIAAEAMRGGAAGLAFVRLACGNELEGAKAIREGLSPEQAAQMIELCAAKEGDLLLIAAGEPAVVNRCAVASMHESLGPWVWLR